MQSLFYFIFFSEYNSHSDGELQDSSYCGSSGGCTSTLTAIMAQTTGLKTFDSALLEANVTVGSTVQMSQFFPQVDQYAVLEITDSTLLNSPAPY